MGITSMLYLYCDIVEIVENSEVGWSQPFEAFPLPRYSSRLARGLSCPPAAAALAWIRSMSRVAASRSPLLSAESKAVTFAGLSIKASPIVSRLGARWAEVN